MKEYNYELYQSLDFGDKEKLKKKRPKLQKSFSKKKLLTSIKEAWSLDDGKWLTNYALDAGLVGKLKPSKIKNCVATPYKGDLTSLKSFIDQKKMHHIFMPLTPGHQYILVHANMKKKEFILLNSLQIYSLMKQREKEKKEKMMDHNGM